MAMKKVVIALMSLALVATISSCKKDNDSEKSKAITFTLENKKYGAEIVDDGVDFTMDYGSTENDFVAVWHGYMNVTDNSYDYIRFDINSSYEGVYSTDNYPVATDGDITNSPPASSISIGLLSERYAYTAKSGTVTLTSTENNKWSGTFSGSFEKTQIDLSGNQVGNPLGTVVITNGKFTDIPAQQ